MKLMLIFPFFLTVLFFEFHQNVWSKEKPEWTKEDARTQGGGWIWFPGKSNGHTSEAAKERAMGIALDLLQLECQTFHPNIQFNEVHIEEGYGEYRAWVRASLKKSDCQEAKKGIKENDNLRLLHYKYKSENVKVDKTLCNDYSEAAIDRCEEMSYQSLKRNDDYTALAYGKKGCEYGDYTSCGYVGLILLGNPATKPEGIVYLKKACDLGLEKACEDFQSLTTKKRNGPKSKPH